MYDVDNHETGSVNSVYSLIENQNLAGIESGATADQTGSEIKVLYEFRKDQIQMLLQIVIKQN